MALYAKLGVNNHFILVPKDKSYKHLHLASPSLNECSSRPDILATAKVIVSIVSYKNTMKLFNLPERVPSASNLISGAGLFSPTFFWQVSPPASKPVLPLVPLACQHASPLH